MAQHTFNIEIPWIKIRGICQRISSFEGRGAVSPDGESDYLEVKITAQDYPLIADYVGTGLTVLDASLGRMAEKVSSNITAISVMMDMESASSTFHFNVDNVRTSQANLANMMCEAVASYAMGKWLSERKPSRQKFYDDLFGEMVTSIKNSLTRKSHPQISDIS